MSPTCSWTCVGCVVGSLSISGGDGLPVELMDFSIEGEVPQQDDADAGQAAESLP